MIAKLYSISLNINQETYEMTLSACETLLETIRKIGLTGSKPGCLNGDCGACTVMIDNQPMKSCLVLTAETESTSITTIEGLKETPIQQAFIDHFAFQCGYCTSGFIMLCHSLLIHDSNPSEETLKKWLSSNICRCTGYQEIEQAVKSMIQTQKGSDKEHP